MKIILFLLLSTILRNGLTSNIENQTKPLEDFCHFSDPIVPFSDPIKEFVSKSKLLETKLSDFKPGKELHITVVLTGYNTALWYKKNLASIYGQDYKNYCVVYVDDASTDNTGALVAQYVKEQKQENRTIVISNNTNQDTCANWYKAITPLDPNTIIVSIDADDWLAKPSVFSLLNKVYSQYNALMTYGSFQKYPHPHKKSFCSEIPNSVIENNSIRSYKWVTSHLRTFKAGLFQRIKKEDLFYQDAFFKRAPDLGLMFPMLEMAGKRAQFIPDILHIYNCATIMNEFKIYDTKDIKTADNFIRNKERYNPLLDDASF